MLRIKLLILLLINTAIFSCTKISRNHINEFNVGYIEGDIDGLIASNFLENHLNGFSALNKKSKFIINGKISHSSDLYITNIDNTSNRERIKTNLNITITDNICIVYSSSTSVSEFYLIAPSTKFKSNTLAIKDIKNNNTEYLVKNLINEILDKKLDCINDN
jgi:hypothetical protein